MLKSRMYLKRTKVAMHALLDLWSATMPSSTQGSRTTHSDPSPIVTAAKHLVRKSIFSSRSINTGITAMIISVTAEIELRT